MSNRVIKILACDPGLSNFGWSLIEYDLTTDQKVILKCGTLTGKTLLKNQKEMQLKFEKRHIILWELEPVLIEMIKEFAPDYIVSESAFAHTFINSYAALVMVIQALRTAAMRAIGCDIYMIAPRESKKAVSADGTSDKESVQAAILRNPKITLKGNKHNPIEKLTEHAYDSIAAGVAFIQNHLPSVLASKNFAV